MADHSDITEQQFIETIQLHLIAYAQRRLQANLCKEHLQFLGDSLEITANEGYQNIQFEWEINPLEIQTKQIGNSVKDLGKLPYKRKIRIQIEYNNLLFSHLHSNKDQRGGNLSIEIVLNSLPINSIRGYESKPPFVFPQDYDYIFWNEDSSTNQFENDYWMVDLHKGITQVAKAIQKGDYVAQFPQLIKIPTEIPPQPYQIEDDELLPTEKRYQKSIQTQDNVSIATPQDAQDNQLWKNVEQSYESFREKWLSMPKKKKIQKNEAARNNDYAKEFEANIKQALPKQMKELRRKVDTSETSQVRNQISHINSSVPLSIPGLQQERPESPLLVEEYVSILKKAAKPAEGPVSQGIETKEKRRETEAQRDTRKERSSKARRNSMKAYSDRLKRPEEKLTRSPTKKRRVSFDLIEQGPTPPKRRKSQFELMRENLEKSISDTKPHIKKRPTTKRGKERIKARREAMKSLEARSKAEHRAKKFL